jgi:ATP-dependent Clp protease ATP-binding subunit ClpA
VGRRVLETALGESKKRDQNYVAIEHILHAVASEEDDLFSSTMRDLAVDPRSVKLLIEKAHGDGQAAYGQGISDSTGND